MKFILTFFSLVLLPFSAMSEEMTDASFAAMLENATLEGTWAPVAGNQGGGEKADRYHIVRAEAKGGDQWVIVWKVQHQGQTINYPIPSVIRFVGDAAVLSLDEIPVGDGKTWSARVLFHKDTYTGKWWGGSEKGGTVSGTISRP